MKHFIHFVIVTMLLLTGITIQAQQPHKPSLSTVIKFKPPVVKTFLGKITGKLPSVNGEEGKQMISLPLIVIDDKNVPYTISSYQFAYKRIGVTEDEETGKALPQSDMVGDHFNTTPLPAIWQSNIRETLHKGEELYFFDIIVLDKQGRRFFAPELKISIQ